MSERTVKMRKAAIYECEEWTARIEEDDEYIRLFWKDQPFGLPSFNHNNAWGRDVLEPLAIVLHTALQARLHALDEGENETS